MAGVMERLPWTISLMARGGDADGAGHGVLGDGYGVEVLTRSPPLGPLALRAPLCSV